MLNLRILLLMLAIAGVSACASNEEKMADDVDAAEEKVAAEADEAKAAAEDKERMMREEAAAREAEAKEAEAKAAAEAADAKAAAKEAEARAATEAREAAEASASGSVDMVATCTYGGQTRVISVVFDNEETGTACEVTYEKSSGVQTLWSANNERDYCVPQAQAFVEKQQGWGWDCSELK